MPLIELRRHSLRLKPSKGLSPEGVRFAAQQRQSMGCFDAYYSSRSRRCRETLEAMGFPTWTELDELGPLGDAFDAFEVDLFDFQRQTGRGYIAGYLALAGSRRLLHERGEALVKALRKIGRRLVPEGKALAISHSGVIESVALNLRPVLIDELAETELSHLEGLAIGFEGDQLTTLRPLRRTEATSSATP